MKTESFLCLSRRPLWAQRTAALQFPAVSALAKKCDGAPLLLLFVLSVGYLMAQALTGTIVGTVTDPSGAAIPNVAITVVNGATNLTRTATTNARGEFRVDSFPTGALTVTARGEGFDK